MFAFVASVTRSAGLPALEFALASTPLGITLMRRLCTSIVVRFVDGIGSGQVRYCVAGFVR